MKTDEAFYAKAMAGKDAPANPSLAADGGLWDVVAATAKTTAPAHDRDPRGDYFFISMPALASFSWAACICSPVGAWPVSIIVRKQSKR